MTERERSRILERVVTLVRWRRLILVNTLLVAIVAVVVSLLLPKWYRATASVYPPQEDPLFIGEAPSIAAFAASALGQGRSISNLFSSPSDLYGAILKSRTVGTAIIRRHDLRAEFEVETMDDALEVLRSRREVRIGSDGIVSIQVVDRDPAQAAEIANDFVEELDAKWRARRRSSAGAVRAFLERRVAETTDSLAAAEAELREVQEETGILAPEAQVAALVESAVQIELGRRMREVELGMLRARVGPGDPERARLAREIDLLEEQLQELQRGSGAETTSFRVPLSELPGRSLSYARALRDVKIQELLYELLMQQFESYRILEMRDTPAVQVLDVAVAPEKRHRPIRWLICVIATGLALAASCLVAFGLDALAGIRREDPTRWETLRRIGRAGHPRRWFSKDPDLPAP